MNFKRFIAEKYWKIFKPRTLGARVLIVNKGKILLIKHTYISGWYIPGGGVSKGETFEEALKREIKEEIGVALKDLQFFGVYQNTREGKLDTEVIFISKQLIDSSSFELDKQEVREAKLFSLDNLPKDISPGSKRRINEYLNSDYPKVGIW